MSENKIPGMVQTLIDDVIAAGGTAEQRGSRQWHFTVPGKAISGEVLQWGVGQAGWYRDSSGKAHVSGVTRVREFAAQRGVRL